MKKLAAVEGIELDKWRHIIYAVNDITVTENRSKDQFYDKMKKTLSVDGNEYFTDILDNTIKGE